VIACNDIYVHATGPASVHQSAIEYGNTYLPAGIAHLTANRICIDGDGWSPEAVSGYGVCPPAASPISLFI
jgi:hypothetical protein